MHVFSTDSYQSEYSNITEGELLTAAAEIRVPAESERLALTITPDASEYLPGGQARLDIQVVDAAGRPVMAQVSLALVDAAIFALAEDKSGDIFAAFHSPRPDLVMTYDSLAPRRYGWSRWDMGGGLPPSMTPTPTSFTTPAPGPQPPGGGQGGSEVQVRREFRDTAYWNPDVRTDAQGRASVIVPLPDNLTTWRVIARAVTVDTKVGEKTTDILVTKDIIARPVLPRFAVVGDRFAVGVVAQNFSGQAVSGTVSLDAPGLVTLDPGERAVDLPNPGSAYAQWTGVASKIGINPVACTLETSAGADAVELPLPVKPFAAPERWSAAGQVADSTVLSFTVPFNAINEASVGVLRLSPSIALGILDGLDALIDYPYGCVEQTMSRVLPSAVAARAYNVLAIPNPKADTLPDVIGKGLQKLYSFQHDNGGWGWWYDDEDSVYMTAYVLFGLTMVQQAGFDVDGNVLDRGFTYLDAHLAEVDDVRIAAYAHYVKSTAGRGDLAAAKALVRSSSDLDAFALAALALTLQKEGDVAAAQTLTDQLLADVVETPTTASWPQHEQGWSPYRWRTMSSTEKNTAMALRALVVLRPDHPLVPKAVNWLMRHRQGAGWRDTQATAFAVLGLTDHILAAEELQADYSYTIALNDAVIAEGAVTPATASKPISPTTITGVSLRTGQNDLKITRTPGAGQLYYTFLLRQQLFYDSFQAINSSDQGLALQRRYSLPTKGPDAAEQLTYAVGDIVEVELMLNAKDDAWYVLLEDPIPAGFEVLSERMNPTSYGDDWCEWGMPCVPGFWWRQWGYNRKEIYDDHVAFFTTHLWPGQHRFTYLMRATTPGEYSVLPAQVYPMYAEEMWGRSASQQVTVAPATLAARPRLVGDFDRNCQISDFDLMQTVGAWHSSSSQRDVNGDHTVDLLDIAAIAARRGADCLDNPPLPGVSNGKATLTLAPDPAATDVGQAFQLDVLASGLEPGGGFELALAYDPTRVRLTGLVWHPTLGDAITLGSGKESGPGWIAFGVFALPSGVTPTAPLATLTFESVSPGAADFEASAMRAVDGQGRGLQVDALVSSSVIIAGKSTFLPMISR